MAVDTNYALTFAQGIVAVAPPNSSDPGAPTTSPTGPGAPYVDAGAITTDGLVENPAQSRTEFKRWGSISPFAAIITDQKKQFQVKFLESNPTVLGLVYRTGTTPTASGTGANEVQAVTITGTPTGGSFTLDFNGQPTTDIAYNATASAVQTALQNLSGIGAGNVAVTGGPGPGSPYTVTFQGTLAAANVATMTAANNLTGGTSPAVTVGVTTQGSAGSLLTITDDTTGLRDVRSWCFDLVQGTNHLRFWLPTGEVINQGNVTYKQDGLVEYDVTVEAYPNSSGIAVKRYFLLDAVRLGL